MLCLDWLHIFTFTHLSPCPTEAIICKVELDVHFRHAGIVPNMQLFFTKMVKTKNDLSKMRSMKTIYMTKIIF